MNMRVDMHDIPSVLRRHVAAQHAAMVRGLRSGARGGRSILVMRTPKDRGMAKLAWKTRFYRDDGVVAANENSAPYIGILEAGARPHAVSKEGQEAIFNWVLRNIRAVGTVKTGYAAIHVNDLHEGQRRRRLATIDKGEQLARQITFLICRKIRLKGQAPHWFVKDSLDDLGRLAREEVERCLKEIPGKVKS
jgi:hypothetical protein